MSADYYFFAPTGGRYQTVFRWTLPRRYSIRRSQRGNSSALIAYTPIDKMVTVTNQHTLISKHDCCPCYLFTVHLSLLTVFLIVLSATHAHICRLSRPKVRCGGS